MDNRLFFPATQRNRVPIGDVLENNLPESGTVLEIASGSGEHGVVFQERFPNINWQTSDCNLSCRKSISAWIKFQDLCTKMAQPIDLDVEDRPWPLTSSIRSTLKVIVCINMIHISPWGCSQALFEEAGKILKMRQLIILYGPFKMNNKHTSESNYQFDRSLRIQNPFWGVRDLEEIFKLGTKNGFENEDVIEMPANNFSIVLRKK